MGGYPSWQFGMGIISNARFYSPIFADYKDIPLIQHTAQADAGSSGGPLLVKSPESQNSYLVVAINTWKIHAIKMQTFPFRLNMQWI